VHKALHKCPWIVDAVIVAVLFAAGQLIEPHEGAEHVGAE
jgi:hypothetical protein